MALLPHILFVDDEPRILDGLRRMLHPVQSRWRMSFVTSGADALALLDREWVDVIVSDVRMPQMNGVELLQRVQQSYPHMARIVLTGHADERDGLAALGPVHQFLAKPCQPDAVYAALERVERFRRLLRDATVRTMIARVESLPTPSDVHRELMAEIDRPNVSLRRIGEIVSGDVSLSAKLLQLVNSSFFGISRKVVAPAHAVSLLGTAIVRAVAISMELFTHAGSDHGPLPLTQFMAWSLDAASLARQVGRRLGWPESVIDEVFLAGLLHDIGELVIASQAPERYRAIHADATARDLEAAERAHLGATHAEVGGYLLSLWGFESTIVDAAVYHHAPAHCPDGANHALVAVHLAQFILPRRNGRRDDRRLDDGFLTSHGVSTDETHWQSLAADAA